MQVKRGMRVLVRGKPPWVGLVVHVEPRVKTAVAVARFDGLPEDGPMFVTFAIDDVIAEIPLPHE